MTFGNTKDHLDTPSGQICINRVGKSAQRYNRSICGRTDKSGEYFVVGR
jgi:hypothetical protein